MPNGGYYMFSIPAVIHTLEKQFIDYAGIEPDKI